MGSEKSMVSTRSQSELRYRAQGANQNFGIEHKEPIRIQGRYVHWTSHAENASDRIGFFESVATVFLTNLRA